MILYVARHGETDWNRAGRYQGRRESSLTEIGRAQAQALASALAERPIGRIISSPLRRCRETAQPLAERLGVPVEIDARAIEIAHGTWEGRLRSDLEREEPLALQRWREEPESVHFDGGESLAEVMARWRAFAKDLGGTDEVLVVTHDVLARLAILDAQRRPLARFWEPRVVNGGYARLRRADGRFELLDECIDTHLGTLEVDTAHQAL
ncbi:MAG: histidine phosphatase family protein [bacterium]|nr:histidine phosphatase family protein [bacterium]